MTLARFRPLAVIAALAGAGGVLVLVSPRPACADRHEATLSIRPTKGSSRIWEAGTDERVDVRSRGFATSASLGARDWLDLGGELVLAYFDVASYQMATLPVKATCSRGRSSGALIRVFQECLARPTTIRRREVRLLDLAVEPRDLLECSLFANRSEIAMPAH